MAESRNKRISEEERMDIFANAFIDVILSHRNRGLFFSRFELEVEINISEIIAKEKIIKYVKHSFELNKNEAKKTK